MATNVLINGYNIWSMNQNGSIEAIKSPERNPVLAAGKSAGEFIANRLGTAARLGMAVAKASYHIREVPMEYDMRPPWKARIHKWGMEAPSS